MRKHKGVLATTLVAASVLAADAPHSVWAQNGNGAARRRLPSARGVLGALPGGMVVVDGQNALLIQGAPAAAALVTETIGLRNVRPGIIAWWLDPAHQPEPIEFSQSRANNKKIGVPNPKRAPGQEWNPGGEKAAPIVLPAGVEIVEVRDRQNALVVRGTAQGIKELRTIVAYLDRPLQQVEVEAQFVEVGAVDAARLLAEPEPVVEPESNSTHYRASVRQVRPNFQNELKMLLAAKSAKLVNAPRLTTFNNMTATVQAMTTHLFSIGDPNAPRSKDEWSLVGIETGVRLTCTPTINRDGTVTLAMESPLPLQMSLIRGVDVKGKSTVFFPYESKDRVQTVANIKDGGTIAIRGLERKIVDIGGGKIAVPADFAVPEPEGKERGAPKPERELLVFVTARVVR